MIWRSRKLIPVALCGVVLIVGLLLAYLSRRYERLPIVQRLEWMTYDWRVKKAVEQESPVASNLGFVPIQNNTLRYLRSGQAGYNDETRFQASLYWPRHVYGQIVDELTHQGADVVGFDVLLGDLRPSSETVKLPDGTEMISDHYLSDRLQASGRVVLAAEKSTMPPPLLRDKAWAVGDIGAKRDGDGVLRRTKAFEDYIIPEPILVEAGDKLDGLSWDTNKVVLALPGRPSEVLPIAADGTFEKARLIELGNNVTLPPSVPRRGLAYRRARIWDLGLTMAAHYLGIDLAAAEIESGAWIRLKGTNSVRREIPIDRQNRMLIDWSLDAGDRRVAAETFHGLLDRHYKRATGTVIDGDYLFRGRVVLVGSLASGNDLTDIGATPLSQEGPLTMRYLNIANSMLVNRFVRQPSGLLEAALIVALGLFSGIFTWNFRALFAGLWVVLLGVAYTALALYLFIANRYWMPMVLPLGGLVAVHVALLTYRVVVEQKERRRIRNIFAKIVSPNVVNELLQAERLAVEGVRREITVFFSDVRGFTEMTDESHARAEEYVKAHRLPPAVAEAYFDEQAQEILRTVNLYLGTIADVVKQHEGTLDKYIGDCVMAFWGAPTPNDRHAVSCVRAAVQAQRAIDALNRERMVENERRERENLQRAGQAVPPLPLLKVLTMGAGINTGVVTLGLMGSERHVYNYTVFGRDVNLAARLEGLSGSGRILIGEATHRALVRLEPELGASCRELAPATVKGFRTPVKVFEVPWHEPGTEPSPEPGLPAPDAARSTRPVENPSSSAP